MGGVVYSTAPGAGGATEMGVPQKAAQVSAKELAEATGKHLENCTEEKPEGLPSAPRCPREWVSRAHDGGHFGGQVTKGLRWMPWRQVPMKDGASAETLRGAASGR